VVEFGISVAEEMKRPAGKISARAHARPSRKPGSDTAAAEGVGRNHNGCGVHTLHFPQLRRDAAAAVQAVEQLFVKAWLMRRI
jgi:hypothetical protein